MATRIGVSSSCFYPLETEKALEKVGQYGFKNTELFFNSFSEIDDSFVSEFIKIKNRYGINIVSVHPFQSFAESFYLFSNYERRWHDILPMYDRLFKVTSMLGAEIFVVHGLKIPGTIDDELYCKRFSHLIDMGAQYGVQVCHENVSKHRGESPQYLKMMRDNIGDKFKIVLDIKQARRAGYTPYDFLDLLSDSAAHIHISDFNSEKDCITPLKGDFNFNHFFKTLEALGYKGKYMIELYEWSYSDEEEIAEACRKLNDMF